MFTQRKTKAMEKIRGGFYLKARCIQDSEIAIAPPHVREIWDWILKEANHKDVKFGSIMIKRGQLLRGYKDIIEGLRWMVGWRKCTYSKYDCETAMKWLKNHAMVTTMKTTRGILITVLNYDKYQTTQNYETYTKPNTTTTDFRQTSDTINKNVKNDKNENNKESDFLLFWKSYQLRKGKEAARKAFMKSDIAIEVLLLALEVQKKERKKLIDRGDFVPNWKYPATWLNQRCWEDEVAPIMERSDVFYMAEMKKLGPHRFARKYDVVLTNKYLNEYMNE